MRHHASPSFRQRYHALPPEIRELADKSFALLGGQVLVGARHRALAVELDENLVWFWIGDHTTYDQLLRRG